MSREVFFCHYCRHFGPDKANHRPVLWTNKGYKNWRSAEYASHDKCSYHQQAKDDMMKYHKSKRSQNIVAAVRDSNLAQEERNWWNHLNQMIPPF